MKHLTIKPFHLLSTIALVRTIVLINNLLMSNLQSKITHMTANPAKTRVRKMLRIRKNFPYTKCCRRFFKNLLPEVAKKTCQLNNRDLNRD